MRRRHNVVLATLTIFGIVFLLLQTQSDLPAAYPYKRPHHKDDGSSPSTPMQVTANLFDEQATIRPSKELISNEAPFMTEHLPLETFSSDNLLSLSATYTLASDAGLYFSPPNGLERPESPPSTLPAFEAEYPFQRDLEMGLPVKILEKYSNNKPQNYNPDGLKTNSYATFMATRSPSLKDPYFLAIHSLIYRLLWSHRSHTEEYPFVVFVSTFTTQEQRALLAGAGAIVRELAPLPWNPNVPGVQNRWKDLFAKLNMWNETEFNRIIFLDADAFPLTNVDEMFNVAPMRDCDGSKLSLDEFLPDGTLVCEPYVFAGVPQDPLKSPASNINVGSMVFTPSTRMHQRLLQNYVKTDRYDCLMAEQAFLDWQFSPDGAFPAIALEREWGGYFPKADEEGKLKIVHEKIWVAEEPWVRKEWVTTWEEMLKFYASMEFSKARVNSGVNTMI